MMPLQNIFASRMGVQAPVQMGGQQTMQAEPQQGQPSPQPGAMQFGARPMMPTAGMPQPGIPQQIPQSGAMLGARQMMPMQPQQPMPQQPQQPQQPMQAQPMQNNLRARLGMMA
jgi:hypothetical protein